MKNTFINNALHCPPSSLTISAVLASLLISGSVLAADVQVYGLIDQGLMYSHVKTTGKKAENTVSMESGMAGASRWGLKGTEALGNGYALSFNLEGKLTTDDGAMGTSGQIFDRESNLELKTPYGSFRIGRSGMLGGGVGGGVIAGQTNPFGVVYKQAGAVNVFQGAANRLSNMVRYESPSMAGFQIYAQYSNATGLEDDEGDDSLRDSQRDRYAALAATYRNGGLRLSAAVDWYLFNDNEGKGTPDARNYSIAGNYDFGDVKVYAGYQYADNMRTTVMGQKAKQQDGHIFMAGLGWNVAGGTLMWSAAYATSDEWKQSGKTYELDAWQTALGYKYPFSKRTMAYAVATYRDAQTIDTNEKKTYTAMMGLQHKF